MTLRVGPALLALSALAISVEQASAQETLDLAPSADWVLREEPESCMITRPFGTADNLVTFRLEAFSRASFYLGSLWGEPLPHRDSGAIEFQTRFNPDGKSLETGGILSKTTAGPMVTFRTSLERAAQREARYEAGTPSPGPDAAREAEVDELLITFSRGTPLKFVLGSMGEPMARLRACAEQLPGKWGLDPAVQLSLSRAPVPLEPGKWLAPGTYPFDLLRAYRSALVQIRLMVDSTGTPTSCAIQSPRTPSNAGIIACREIMKTAKFEPALDATGVPAASVYSTSIMYYTKRRNGSW